MYIRQLPDRYLGTIPGIRTLPVGITGTNYLPPDDFFEIKQFLKSACEVINEKANAFEKALLAVVLISYIQPFNDGNKRCGRMLANALLVSKGYCQLSYRDVEPLTYKMAMLLFYEQNNLSAFKELFMEQVRFAVGNYFQA